jgi:LacI family transcriptional regulator
VKNRNDSATLLDVARIAKVSLKTASRVLNDTPHIRPETAARVRAAMSKLGYQPNELARGLKARRSAAIAMIVPNLADPFTATAVQAVQAVAREHGHVVVLASSGGDIDLEKSELRVMARRQIDGAILVPASAKASSLDELLAKKIPVVVFDEPIRGEHVDSIIVPNRRAAREATEHLLWHGYRRILAVGARPYLFTCVERVAGYRQAMKMAGAEKVELLVQHEKELTPDSLSGYLFGPSRVDAIFTLNWVCTILVLRVLNAMGKKVGKDVAIISFDDFELAEMIAGGLTVVRQPSHELGRQAAEVLFDRISGPDRYDPRKVVVDTEFIVRGSCGCGKGAPAWTPNKSTNR